MALLIDRINILRPRLSRLQVETLCHVLSHRATDEQICQQELSLPAAKSDVGALLGDYLYRNNLDGLMSLREFRKLFSEVEMMLKEGADVPTVFSYVNKKFEQLSPSI